MVEHPKEYYGGNSWQKGSKYFPNRCAAEVYSSAGWSSYQCSRRKGHGKDGLFCKQHAKQFPVENTNG